VLAATLGLALAFTGLTVATSTAPALADGAGQPFSCTPPTFFTLSENASNQAQLYKGSYAANGTAAFTALGGLKSGTSLYNALAYNPVDSYLYGIAYNTASNTGHVMRVDSAGNVTDLGATSPALGTPPNTLWDSGEFDAAGNYYVFDGNAGTTKLYKIAGVSSAPGTVPTLSTITLSASVTAADFGLANGYLWAHGYGNSNFYRINPTTGAVTTVSSTVIPALDYGSAFTMGNGNLAFISTTGVLEQVKVTNPTATPTFSLVGTATAPTNSRSDATNCSTRPTDLSIVKDGNAAVLAGNTITWTLTVHNAGPGVSTGFVVNDTLPATIPITTAPTATSASAGCTVSGRAIACNGTSLAVGADAVITVTAKSSGTSTADVVNTATVLANEQDLVAANNTSTYTTKIGNQPLVLTNDTATTPYATPTNILVLANDTNTGGDVTAATTPTHGTATINADNSVTYTPAAGFSGTDTFTYTVTDATGQKKTATVTVTVTPVASDDTATTPVNTAIDVNVIANDSGSSLALNAVAGTTHGTVTIVAGKAHFVPAAGFSGTGTFTYTLTGTGGTDTATATVAITPTAGNESLSTTAGTAVTDTAALSNDVGTGLTVTAVTNGAHGSVTIVGGLPVYTPAANFSGTDSFTYTVTDASNQTATATVSVAVAPRAVNDAASTPANAAASVPVLANDLGANLAVTAVTNGAHGTVAIVAGLPLYTPAAGFSGTDTFTYTVTGTGGTSTATVTMTVNPVAVTDTATVESGDAITINALGNDLGTGVSLNSTTNGAHGTVAIVAGKLVYTSTAGYSGVDSFTYSIIDAAGHTASITDTITVTPGPVGAADSASTIAGTPVTVDVLANDSGTGLTLQSVANGTNGSVSIVSGKAVYTPNTSYSGTDTFTYTGKDAAGHTYTASVTVAVSPKAIDDAATTAAGSPVTVNVAANDLGSGLAVTATTNGAHGTVAIVAGKPVFTPAVGFSGADTFTYTVTDGAGRTATATVFVTVTPKAIDDSTTTAANASVSIPVLANDLGTGNTVTSVTNGAHGTVSIVAGLPVYSPATNYSGADAFTYTIKDAAGNSSTATVTVSVKPSAVPDVATTQANTPVSVTVLPNDLGTGLSVTAVTNGTHGTVVITGGKPVYTPATSYSGPDSFTYTITDQAGSTSTVSVGVAVTPVAANDAATTAAGATIDIPVVTNDAGTLLMLTSVGSAVNGTVTVVGGKARFVPSAGFSGAASFSYVATDSAGQTTSASVAVTVTPVAVNDSGTAFAGVPASIPVLANDLGSAKTVTAVTSGAHGTVVITSGLPVYTPAAGFSGADSFTYTMTDGSGSSSTATVTMTVSPVAIADSAATEVGDPVTVTVLTNDLGTDLSVTSATNGSHGTVSIVAGKPVYTPAAGYVGTDSFTYSITGAGGTSTATVTVSVIAGPVGVNDSATTTASTPVTIDVIPNDSGSGLALQSSTNGSNGTVSIAGGKAVYAPTAGFSGTDSFTYTGKDAANHTYTATVTVTVTPVAHGDSATTAAGTPVDVTVVTNDDGSALAVTSVGSALNGTVAIVAGKARFTPSAGFSGAASFSYVATDSSGQATTATVAVTVTPRALADSATTNAGSAVTVDALANDLGSGIALSTVSAGANGTAAIVAGKIVYTPAAGFSGTDTVSYSVSGAGGTSTSTIAITVKPVAVNDTATNVSGDPVTVDVLANDLGTGKAVTSVTDGAHGTVVITAGKPVYTPAAGYAGPDSFSYTMTDAAGNSSNATVAVTVQAAPTATNDAATILANATATVDVLANDHGTSLTLFSVTQGTNGSVAIVAGKAVYTPNHDFSGADTFTYIAKDSTNHAVSATVTITVTPTAASDIATTVAGSPEDVAVLANDAGSSLALTTVSLPVGGTVSILAGKARFVPAAGFSGAASFSYLATDASGQTASSTVTVTVTPLAAADSATVNAGASVSVPVLTNDLGTAKTVASATNGSHGTVVITAGLPVYTPAGGFSGTDSFTYTLSAAGGTSVATVTVIVKTVAVADSATSVSGDAVSVDVLPNDLGTGLSVTSATNGTHGTVAIVAGKPVYTPNSGYAGSDSFTYTITDGVSTSTATVTVSVTAAPTAANDTATTPSATPVTVNVLANDSGTGLALFSASNGANGTVAIVSGKAVYTPAAGFSGTDTFSYIAKDSTSHAVTATVTVTVTPVAHGDSAATSAGTPVDIAVLSNDEGSTLVLTSVASALNGTVAIVAGKARFTPSAGFSGAASFSYLATDSSGQTTTATVAVTVSPRAVGDAKSTNAGTPVTVDALANDLGTALVLSTVSAGANGTAAIVSGKVVYTPAAGFSGSDSLTYSITGAGGTSTATIALTILPIAVNDTAANISGDPITVDVLANDLGTGKAVTSVTDGSHGTVVIASGKPVYTPAAAYAGSDSFSYTMTDAAGNSSTATVAVTVQAAPTASNDATTTPANTPATVDVLANDHGTGLTLSSVTQGANGSVAIVAAKAVYTPSHNFSGADAFTYTAKDSTNHPVTASVAITVTPVASADSATTASGVVVVVDVTANDAGSSLALTTVTSPVGGTVAIVSGKAEFTPAANFSGTASFSYTAKDSSNQTTSSTATITVTPTALADAATTTVGTAVSVPVLSNDLGTGKSVASVTTGSHGSVVITGGLPVYTPAAAFSGADTFTYTLAAAGGTSVATVTVTVTPTAANDTANSVSGEPVAVDVLANDSGSGLSVVSATDGSHGTVVITAGKPVYTPTPGYAGADSFTYVAKDSSNQAIGATVTVSVTAAPTAADDSASTPASTPVTIPVLGNDHGTALALFSASNGTNGSVAIVAGKAVYTPAAGFSGTDTFSYIAKDSTNHAAGATVTVTVTPVAHGDSAATLAGTPVDINVVSNDDGSLLALTSVGSALNGTVSITGGKARFTPAAGFSGAASFSYIATDASGQATTSTVAIAVSPRAVSESAATNANIAVTIDALGNDLGAALGIIGATNGSTGSVSIVAGKLVYTPAAGFSGSDSFSYTISGAGGTSTAVDSVTVAPVAANDAAANVSGDPVTIDALGNDLGTTKTITSVTAPSHGSVAIVAGKLVYTPAAAYAGLDSFSYTMTDAAGQTSSAAVTLTVQAAPTAADDAAMTPANVPTTVDILGNDHGTALAIASASNGANGTVAILSGKVVYTPNHDFSGIDSFGYIVKDSTNHAVGAIVTVTVTPVALSDSATTAAATPVDIDVAANDSGSGLTLGAVATAVGGTVAIVAGKAEFTPAAGFSGAASFSYTVTDGSNQTATATASITVVPRAVTESKTTTAGATATLNALSNDLGTGLSITGKTNGAHGTVAILLGKLVYTPAAGFSGADSFTYTITGAGGSSTATDTVTVTPVAAGDTAHLVSGDSVSVDVLANDLGTGLTVTGTTNGAHGTVAIVSGSPVYASTLGYAGPDGFTYTATDLAGNTVTATVAVTVTAGPTGTDDAATTVAGAAVTIDALANDSGTGLGLVAATAGANGSTAIVAGKIVYTPATGFSGTDTFTYTGKDATNHPIAASVSVTVAPKAKADSASVSAGSSKSIDVLANDHGSALVITGATDGTNGTVTIVGGALSYTAGADYSGTDTFTYDMSDGLNTAEATVTMTVTPVAVDDSATTQANSSVTVDAASNDHGSSLALTNVANGAHGTAAILASKAVYTPSHDFSGTDTFSYTVSDADGQQTTGTVTLTVTPYANPDSVSTSANSAVSVAVTGNDHGSALGVTATTDGATGTVSVVSGSPVYTPGQNFSGTDSFTYTVSDSSGQLATATVTVSVTPVASADALVTVAGSAVNGNVVANDAGSSLVVTGATNGIHGAVALQPDGTVTYSPVAGFSGTDTFTYTATDGVTPVTATVTVTVTPLAMADAATTNAGGAVTLSPLSNDNGSGLTLTSKTNGAHGTVVIEPGYAVQYAPAAGFSGVDSFTYTLTDASHRTSTATVTVTVTPQAVTDVTQTVTDTAVTIDAASNDLGAALALTSVTDGAHGTVSIVAGKATYTPAAGFSGADSFDYVVTDGSGQVSTGTVNVLVTPYTPDDAATTPAEAAVTIDVLANDAGTGLALTSLGTPSHGTASIVGNAVRYVPVAGFSGTDTFTYTSTDDASNVSTATVTVFVTPIAVDHSSKTVVGSAVMVNPNPANIGSGLVITHLGSPAHGSAVVTLANLVVYTPVAGFSGTDSMPYTATDSTGQTSSAMLWLTISPLANADSRRTASGTPVSIPVLANDLGSALTVNAHTNPTHGTVTFAPSGVAVYEPQPGFFGTDLFTYSVQDASGQDVSSTVTIVVDPSRLAITGGGPSYRGHGLAFTGSDPTALMYFALMLLVAGIAVWVVARRRRARGDRA
jgi:hypothetical protein